LRDAKITNDFDPKRETDRLGKRRKKEKENNYTRTDEASKSREDKEWARGSSIYPKAGGESLCGRRFHAGRLSRRKSPTPPSAWERSNEEPDP
jgi:hypothetical protein